MDSLLPKLCKFISGTSHAETTLGLGVSPHPLVHSGWKPRSVELGFRLRAVGPIASPAD